MYASLLFWLLLLVPGYAVARHLARDDLKSGLLGSIAVSYLAVFALLSPFSILAYLLGLPLVVFSIACLVAVAAGFFEITRQGWWREAGRLVAGGFCLELMILMADMAMSAWSGSLIAADAVTHLTRIRSLLDHGFNNVDPFVGPPYFFATYHTNLLHALYAACTQLTGIFHVKVWFVSLAWAKLLVASGAYFLVWCLYERRWVAWVAAVYTIGFYGPVSFLPYPNKLAPLWLCAMLIGWSIQAPQKAHSPRWLLKPAAASLVLGQFHALYVGFACVILLPVLGFVSAHRLIRRKPDSLFPALCGAAVLIGLPFPLLARARFVENQPSITQVSDASPADKVDDKPSRDRKGAVDAPKLPPRERGPLRPRAGWGSPNWMTPFLAGGIILSLVGRRRKYAVLLLAMCGMVLAVFHIPPLCSAFISLLGKKWMLARMGFVLRLGFLALGVASYACWMANRLRARWMRGIVSILALGLGAFAAPRQPALYTWPKYWQRVTADRTERHAVIRRAQTALSLGKNYIPRGTTVLIEEKRGMALTMVHDCYIVAPKGGGKGITDLRQRRKDLQTMMAPDTPWSVREPLLRQYRITRYLPGPSGFEWAIPHAKRVIQYGPGYYVFVLNLD